KLRGAGLQQAGTLADWHPAPRFRNGLVALPLALVFAVGPLAAQSSLPAPLREVRFDQKLNEQVPLDLVFADESGHSVTLADYCRDKPVILVLAYFRCP